MVVEKDAVVVPEKAQTAGEIEAAFDDAFTEAADGADKPITDIVKEVVEKDEPLEVKEVVKVDEPEKAGSCLKTLDWSSRS